MAKQRGRTRVATWFSVVLAGLFGLSTLAAFQFTTVVVDGDSMLPTFKSGDRLLVSKAFWLVGGIDNDDVVVVEDENPDGYIIKRVFRRAGETVPLDKVPEEHRLAGGEYVVPDGHLFVLGDNLLQSEDSRAFGPVLQSRVIGKFVMRL